MPTFDTPDPISVVLDLSVGDVRATASERADTRVEVRPSDESDESDVKAAEQTRIEYADGRLLVKAPKQRGIFGRIGSVDVTVELPAGSHFRGETQAAAFQCTGRLGDCSFKTATGDIQLEQTGSVQLNTAAGDVTVLRAVGQIEISTGSGAVHIREIEGAAVIKNSNGDCWIGQVSGDLRVNAANGAIAVDQAGAGVQARTANGDVRIGEVVRGSVVLGTGIGELEVGIRHGTAARLDVSSLAGTVHNSLVASDRPEPSDERVEVRARTSLGDVVIRRS